jgi:hypothetical protein
VPAGDSHAPFTGKKKYWSQHQRIAHWQNFSPYRQEVRKEEGTEAEYRDSSEGSTPTLMDRMHLFLVILVCLVLLFVVYVVVTFIKVG